MDEEELLPDPTDLAGRARLGLRGPAPDRIALVAVEGAGDPFARFLR